MEDMPASRHSTKLVNEQKSSLPNSTTKPGITVQKGSKKTVPQPFALATKRRVSGEVPCTSVSHSTSNGEKLSDRSSSSPASMAKKSPSATPRKPQQSDNTNSQEEDSYSITSSTVTSARGGKKLRRQQFLFHLHLYVVIVLRRGGSFTLNWKRNARLWKMRNLKQRPGKRKSKKQF